MRKALTGGLDGYCERASRGACSDASRSLLARVTAAGAAADFTALQVADWWIRTHPPETAAEMVDYALRCLDERLD